MKAGDCSQTKDSFQLIPADKKAILFAEEAADFCSLKSVDEAIWFLEYLIKKDEPRRFFFQKKLADLYFNKVKDFEKAIYMYSELQQQTSRLVEKGWFGFYIATAYFEIKKWDQALKEIKKYEIPENQKDLDVNFLFLEARVLLLKGQYDLSVQKFLQIQEQSPIFFEKHRMFLYLSLIYESQKKFKYAQKVLKGFETSSEFLVERIERLKIRQKNRPRKRRM